MTIIPIPTHRSSDVLLQSRLLNQLQQHQLDLLRVQDRLATGLRLSQPSDDSAAALRAIRLQLLLEQKKQTAANLRTTGTYLTAADDAVARLAESLIEVRGLAVSSLNTITSDAERTATATQIRRAVEQLMQVANRDFRGRFLFAGSRAQATPFESANGYVAFRGNDRRLPNYVDLGLLVDANLTADEVFGVYSNGVEGAVDLNPVLTEETLLSDLKGGRGVALGSFIITDGQNSSTIDLSSAVTIGDVIRLIESNPPNGRQVEARLSSGGLTIELTDDSNGGSLGILEQSGGTTAAELGILRPQGVGVEPLVGEDLNPRLLLTTQLRDILGVRASGVLRSEGLDNDLYVEATTRGTDGNGLRIHLVDDSLLQAAPGINRGEEFVTVATSPVAARAAVTFSGANNNLIVTANTPGEDFNQVDIQVVDAGIIGNSAVVNYDALNKRLTIGVDSLDQTQIQTVIAAIGSSSPFTASYDASSASDGGYVATAVVFAADAGAVSGNTGHSGGAENTVFVNIANGQSTANNVRDALQASASASALISVEIDDKDATIEAAGGDGPVEATAVALTGGVGIEFDQTSGMQITNGDSTYTIDLSAAETVEDLLNIINGAGANVLAEISDDGSRINVRSILSGSDLSIGENGGQTASQLGLRSFRETTRLADLNHGLGVDIASGTDFTIIRNDGVELDIELAGAEDIQDVLDAINNHPANSDPVSRVTARLAEFGNGIELVDEQAEGADSLTIVKRRSRAAWDLGLIPIGAQQASSTTPPIAAEADVSFPSPNDVNTALTFTAVTPGLAGNDVEIQFINSGTVLGDFATASFDSFNKILTIDTDPTATTANAVIAALAASPDFSAALDTSIDGTNNGSGVIGFTGTAGTTAGGSAELLRGSDVNGQEVEGVFNTLIKMANAIEDFDLREMTRLADTLNEDLSRLTFARAEMGSRGQFLDTVQARLEDEDVELRKALSDEIDADLAQTISELTTRQTALQASLQLIGRTTQLTLLDFI